MRKEIAAQSLHGWHQVVLPPPPSPPVRGLIWLLHEFAVRAAFMRTLPREDTGATTYGGVTMDKIDPIARAVDWLDACRANDADAVCLLYAPDAHSSIPSSPVSGPGVQLRGVEQHRLYWAAAFEGADAEAFELVEIYPGCNSAVLVYYDRHYRRICEFLQFNNDGLIALAARHVIPQRRQVAALSRASDDSGAASSSRSVLRCEARHSLAEARQLPVGPARNGLRQRAVALKALSEHESYRA